MAAAGQPGQTWSARSVRQREPGGGVSFHWVIQMQDSTGRSRLSMHHSCTLSGTHHTMRSSCAPSHSPEPRRGVCSGSSRMTSCCSKTNPIEKTQRSFAKSVGLNFTTASLLVYPASCRWHWISLCVSQTHRVQKPGRWMCSNMQEGKSKVGSCLQKSKSAWSNVQRPKWYCASDPVPFSSR